MARGNFNTGPITLYTALEEIRGKTIKERDEGLKNLRAIFDRSTKADNLNALTDKAYHKILEDLFRVVLDEKKNLSSTKKTVKGTAATRLQGCADAVRIVLQRAASKLKAKTVEAVVDHITQTLPDSDEKYCEHIAQHYLKALSILLERRANVEHLKQDVWIETVDFCLKGINQYLDDHESEPSGLSRSLSGHLSSGNGNIRTQSQVGSLTRQNTEDLLQVLSHLISAPNAPLSQRCDVIAIPIISLLSSHASTVSQLQKIAFSILNAVLSFTREDRPSLSKTIALAAIPIIRHFWQGKSVAKDEMLSSVRDEMLILLLITHLYLERSVMDEEGDISSNLNDLLEIVRAEYARRLERDQLQLEDVDMADLGAVLLDATPFQLNDFRLRLHNTRAERNWANLQVIGILERLVSLGEQQRNISSDIFDDDASKHPRKRQRTAQSPDRLLGPLKSEDQSVRSAALQILPFVLQQLELSGPILADLLDQLSVCTADKRGSVASWAFLAIASCTHQLAATSEIPVDWLQLWHSGARALTYSSTCRAASSQLHAMLASGLVQYHEVGEDVEAMITAADSSGPVVLCDSSILFMMHLLHVRVTEVPGASLRSCTHVTRWLLSHWNPAEKSFAVQSAAHVPPSYIIDLLRTGLGLPRLSITTPASTICDSVAQAWQLHLTTRDVIRYLLLLHDETSLKKVPCCSLCPSHSEANSAFRLLDTGRFQSIRKLVLELIAPKLSELMQNWKKYNEDRSSAIAKDTFQRGIDACITLLLLVPHYADIGSPQLYGLQADLQSLISEILKFLNDSGARDSKSTQTLIEKLLQAVQPYLPGCGSGELARRFHEAPDLQRFFVQMAEILDQNRSKLEFGPSGDAYDPMDVDDDFGSQRSLGRAEGQNVAMPRTDLALDTGSRSFYAMTTCRLMLLATMSEAPDVAGFIPAKFFDQLLSMADEELLSCRGLLRELLGSDLAIKEEDGARLVGHLGENILASNEYDRCEIALGICLDVLYGLASVWVGADGTELSELASVMYKWLITKALPNDIASPAVLKGTAKLLLLLMRLDNEQKSTLPSPSPRTNLFQTLQKGNVSIQFYIGNQLPEIFELYTLKAHDEVFVDVLKNLPSDPDRMEGIACRLFVLAKLAARWPTLLRRCIYHIFETPGRIKDSVDHAARCVSKVSSELRLDDTRELFQLFAPQLLYTWLECDPIEDIPYKIFGFQSLRDLVASAQEEATALMVMRGQHDAVDGLSDILGITEIELLQRSFTKVTAYSIAHDTHLCSSSTPTKHVPSETRVRKTLGGDMFFECVNLHFADIVALLFNTTDHGDGAKYFKKQTGFAYAAQIMEEIKGSSSSHVVLPPNQQPTFRIKNLIPAIQILCSKVEHESSNLFTPALVTYIARKILCTIHPALGSLHACSVLRKLRILISLSGDAAIKGYPLEMLLHGLRPFITDPECADDAIGIVQYLITRGSTHLLESPRFVAGIALSIFGSLRVFLQSTPASTTQDSQYKEMVSKAQKFHTWMANYVNNYNTPALSAQSESSFRGLMQSAVQIGSVGNADIGTAESDLLLRLLDDEKTGGSLLSQPSRELSFQMLCSDFQIPTSFRTDLLGSDDLAIENAAVVWKSCRGESVSKHYLAWAARVLGRAFSASGHIHEELLQESSLSQIKELGISVGFEGSSEACVLGLLQNLTLGHDRRTAGLAESTFRVIITEADEELLKTCQRALPTTVNIASSWLPYQPPPSDTKYRDTIETADEPFGTDAILKSTWVRDLAIYLARSVLDDPLLPALVPILRQVSKFADRAFPYMLHLVLEASFQGQHYIKKNLSTAFTTWFDQTEPAAKDNLKMVINSLLYLRTQTLPNEKSSADRSQWLDIDYMKAAKAAKSCGMFKTALLFTEEFCSESGTSGSKSSRRSSAIHEAPDIPIEMLLNIFENIDDPDLYYGVQQNSSLASIQARLDYEKDGPKSLAFRGAQYDSHVRSRAPESAKDVQALVNALDVLSLSGLSHSLLQAQATVGMSSASLESMFRTARKLEQWDIPVPSNRSSNSVTLYKAFQAVNTAPDYPTILRAIDEGLDCTMASLVRDDLSASALHGSLQTLAALVELDEVLSSQGSEQFEEMVARFRGRENWMKIGRFEDINQILSCRGTTLSTLSQQTRLHKIVKVAPVDTRFVEVQTALLASELSRAHNALQDSLSLATSLIDLIPTCRDLNLNLEVAIHLEAANALWDQGEITSSIGILQALEKEKMASLKRQDIPIGRSKLLSQIGSRVSDARLEKPDRILESYLKPALNELKGKNDGSEAGHVYHQFAVFCDQQLQDADGLEDLKRLKKLSMMKEDEVKELTQLVNASPHNDRNKVKQHLQKAKTWLKLDQEELHRHVTSRDEFLRQSLENYLLALCASDEHDNSALRFTALWLEHSETHLANEAVSKHVIRVASRKFAPLMNQLTSRLQDNAVKFQRLLFALVLRIATDHPFHGMYQIYAGAASKANSKDETALLRNTAARKLMEQLAAHQKAGPIWNSIAYTNKIYCLLALEKDERYRSGRKLVLKESPAGMKLMSAIVKCHIPPPTMQIDLAADMNYSKLPVMTRFESILAIASGVSAPKVITAIATNGERYKQLVKGGSDDLRQDAIMEQVFEQVSELLKTNRSTRQRNLSIRTYKVVPLTSSAGIIEWVLNTMPLHEYLMPAHERYYPKDYKGNQCRKEIGDVQTQSHSVRVAKFRKVMENFHPVMRYFFTEKFTDPDEWFVKRVAYTRSTAAISILGHVLGLGDRHGHNILLDAQSGEVVHIDLGVAFEMGRVLPVPELVPFRLTRDIVDGMGITKTEGVFRRCCEFTLEALRKEVYTIMTILDVLRYDPLYSWSISPLRLAKLQEGQSAAPEQDVGVTERTDRVVKEVNEPGEADRALTIVNKKLSKTLSVAATVNDLINQAKDEANLAVLYSGWAAYA